MGAPHRLLSASFVVLSIWVAASQTLLAAPPPLPPPPSQYVLDEPHVLNPRTLNSIQNILSARDRDTGQQVVIAIFESLQGEDLVAWTNQIFHHWKIGQKGKDNGVLLALYWKDRKARIEVGYGLEAVLTDAKAKRILSESLLPELKAGHPDQAIAQATQELLRIIDDPNARMGKKEKPWNLEDFILDHLGLLLVGFFITVFLWNFFSDTYLSQSGMRKTRRSRSRWYWPDDWGGGGGGFGGGGFGGGGDSDGGGGFSGGGGRSGGGGASGGW